MKPAALDSGRLLRLLLFVAIFSLAAVPPLDPDLWWHLANGRLLLALGSWPHTDLYSFSAAGHAWVMHEWLSDLGMFALYQLGGLPLLVAAFATIVTAGAGCLYLLLRFSGLHPTAAVVVTLTGALAGSTAWGARPQLVNLIFTGLLVLGLQQYQRRRLPAWWLAPFLWVWANLHSGFLLGVVLTGLFLLGEGIDHLRGPLNPIPAQLRALAIALAAGTGLTLINPYGISGFLFSLGTLSSSSIQNNIQEWASPDFHSLAGRCLEALLLVLLLGLGTGRVKARTSEWLWMLGSLTLALASQRHVPLFALAAAPLLGRSAQAALGLAIDALRLHQGVPAAGQAALIGAPFPAPSRSSWGWPAFNAAALLLVAAAMIGFRALPNLRPSSEAAELSAVLPVESTSALAGLQRPLRIFNYYGYGGYLVFKLQTQGGLVFIDGRVEVYGPQVFADYLQVSYAQPGWRDVIGRYHPDAVMLPNTHPLEAVLSGDPAWRPLARDRVATVFVPTSEVRAP